MTRRFSHAMRAATGAGYIRQRAHDTLKANILNGHLRRGERLSETRLMREFGIGRTPIFRLRHRAAAGKR